MKVISICLSDIPKDLITEGSKNKKKYVSLVVDDRKQPDNYGNDVTVYLNQTKEERLAKKPKTYIGSGKNYEFNKVESVTPEIIPNHSDDDLPF